MLRLGLQMTGSSYPYKRTMEDTNTGRVLFICTANVCRSPMAANIFEALAKDADLPWSAESAGVSALVGRPMADNSQRALQEVGIYPRPHVARQVERALLESANLVLTTTPRQAVFLKDTVPSCSQSVYTLPEFAVGAPAEEEIADPYGFPLMVFRSAVHRLFEYLNPLVKRIALSSALGDRERR